MTDWLSLVRRAARTNANVDALAAQSTGHLGDIERAVSASLRTTRRNARRLVHGFERLASVDGSPEARGRAARLRGSWLLHGGDAAGALEHYERAEQLLTGLARDGARLGIAGAQLRLGRTDDAAATCGRVRRSALRRGDQHAAAASDLNCGVALIEGGQPKRALTPLRRAVDAFSRAGNEMLAASAEQALANALVLLDSPVAAEPLLAAASDRLAAGGMRHEAARCLLNRAALLRRVERLDEAESALVTAEADARALGDATLAAQCRLERAEVLLGVGLADEASDLVRTTLQGLRRAPPMDRTRARLVAATAALVTGDLSGASARLGSVLPVRSALLDGRRHMLRARVALQRGRLADARREAQSAARAFGAEHPVSRTAADVVGAESARRAGDLRAARRLLARASSEHETPHSRFTRSAIEFLVEADAGRRAAADSALAAARAALVGMRAARHSDRTRAAVLLGRDAWVARAVRHLLDTRDDAREAERFLDELRARALLEFRADVRAVVPGGDDVDVARARLEALERRLDGDPGDAAIRAGEQNAPTQPAPSRARLRRAERRLALALSPRETGHATASPTTRPDLAPGTVAITYFIDDDGAFAFVERADELHVRALPTNRADLDAAVRTLRFRLAQHAIGNDYRQRHGARLRRTVDAALAAVAARVLAPLAADIEGCDHVVVIPHGATFAVPFAALPLAAGTLGDAPLVQHVTVTFAPSRSAVALATSTARGAPLVLAFADERADAIREEAAHVAALLPRSRLRTGTDATRGALSGSAAPRVLHIAAHGRHRPESPAMSGLLLADGWLRAADLAQARLGGSTVVLSGCETGVATPRAGGEVLGLVRGALLGGARSVVASLWRVDDPATARLMALFHEARRGRTSAADALAQAQRRCIADGAGPWLWAGFAAWTAGVGTSTAAEI